MADDTRTHTDGYLYDAVLTQVDAARGTLIFTVADTTHRLSTPHITYFTAGAIGRLRLPTERQPFAFHIYADQRLRRAPELDEPSKQRCGWKIGDRRFTVQSGLLPGRNGNVVPRDTQPLTLDLPREFLDFCEVRGLTPSAVLLAFIADLCALQSLFVCPREDGYSSNGSDERNFAESYFQRTFGWVDDPEHRAKVRAARRSRKPPEPRETAQPKKP
jgi:hypothetical protein